MRRAKGRVALPSKRAPAVRFATGGAVVVVLYSVDIVLQFAADRDQTPLLM